MPHLLRCLALAGWLALATMALAQDKAFRWYPAAPPLCQPSTGLCPADYFGCTLVARLPAGIKVGVVERGRRYGETMLPLRGVATVETNQKR